MSEPFVGVTCDIHLPRGRPEAYNLLLDHRYAKAIKDAGGYPVLLPVAGRLDVVQSYLRRVDGLVIVGGDDVDPRLYSEGARPGTRPLFKPRGQFERWLYEEARNRRLPVFGICYGMQLIAVLEGCALYQDIRRDARSTLNHHDRKSPMHRVSVEPNSRLAHIMGRRSIPVESEHHQAVKTLGPGFRAVSRAADGIIEAIECDDESILAVQWHPERTLRSAATRRLFSWFVDLCCRHRPGESSRTCCPPSPTSPPARR